jgi:glycosyltransferase involved in cell wall biosynthesis
VNRLQDVADVICGPVGRLQAISRKAVGSEPALEELSEWDLRPRRRPLAGAGETIVPIGERILSILALAHRNRKRRRVLFFAPVNLPTFQLSFAKPFSLPEAQREIVYELVTADDIKASGGKPGEASDGERRWLAEKVKLFRPTLIAFCRYAGPHQDWLLDLARQLEIPTVFHIDDDLLNVPAVLGEKKVAIHSAAPRLQAIRQLLDESDLVYCSTERLKRKFASIGALAPLRAGDIYCPGRVISPATMRPVRKVGYMASADHSHNLTALLPAIVEFLRRHPDVSFEFFGSIPRPRELQEFGSRVLTVPPIKDYARFLEEFALREWDVGICPLSPIEFNLSKANTKWVEYTSIGAAVVASGGTVYDGCCADGCGIVAESADEWLLALDALASDPVARFEQVQRAQSRLVNDYTIERLLTQVLDVFDEAAVRRNGVGERLYTPSKAA